MHELRIPYRVIIGKTLYHKDNYVQVSFAAADCQQGQPRPAQRPLQWSDRGELVGVTINTDTREVRIGSKLNSSYVFGGNSYACCQGDKVQLPDGCWLITTLMPWLWCSCWVSKLYTSFLLTASFAFPSPLKGHLDFLPPYNRQLQGRVWTMNPEQDAVHAIDP